MVPKRFLKFHITQLTIRTWHFNITIRIKHLIQNGNMLFMALV